MKGQDPRKDSPFGIKLKELLDQRSLNRAKLAKLMQVEPSIVTKLCKEDLKPTLALRKRLRTIIELLHGLKPLSIDEANELLKTIPALKELDERDNNDFMILNLLRPPENQLNEMDIDNLGKVSIDDTQVLDTQPSISNLQPLQSETDENTAKTVYQEGVKLTVDIPKMLVKKYYVLLALICMLVLIAIGVTRTYSPMKPHSYPLSTPVPISLASVLYQAAPDCTNPSGTLWTFPLPETKHICKTEGLLMQKNSQGYYAEADLDDVKGTPYNQTRFRVHIQVTFQNPHDTSTRAVLFVQTPQAPGVAGGYMCAINSNGQWQLLKVKGAEDIPVISQGAITINLAHPTTITIEVLNSRLYCAIDNTWVVSWSDNLNPSPGAVSLMVIINSPDPSSPIMFSNFELDQ